MDPGLLKLLDDDEDYNAPPAADVDAFAAVLKGDLGGAAGSSSAAAYGMSLSGNGTLQPLPPTSSPSVSQSGNSGSKPNSAASPGTPAQQQRLNPQQLTPQQQAAQKQAALQWSQLTPQQQQDLIQRRALQQRMLLQQQQQQQSPVDPAAASSTAPAQKRVNIKEGISFTALMPLLQPHLPPEQGNQLAALYMRFKGNEITREDFIRGARVIAGDQVLIQTIRQMQMKQQQQQHLQQQQAMLRAQQQLPQTPSPPQLLHPQGQPQGQLQVPQVQAHAQSQGQVQQPGQGQTPTSTQGQLVQPHAQPPQMKVQTQQEQLSQSSSSSSVPPPSPRGGSKQVPEATGAMQTSQTEVKPPATVSSDTPGQNGALPTTLGLPQAVPSQGIHVSAADVKPLTQPLTSQPVPQVGPGLAQARAQAAGLVGKQGEQQQQELGALGQQQASLKSSASQTLHQVKLEVDKSIASLQLARQQQIPPSFSSVQQRPPTSFHQMPVVPVVPGAVPVPQPYTQKAPPQLPAPAQASAQAAPGQQPPAVTQGLAASKVAQAQSQTPAQPTPPPEKPLTKYAKQKLRKEQKKREEEERQRKLAEEERLRNQSQPPSTIPPGSLPQHPPRAASASLDLNKQAFGHQPGSLSQQAQLQAASAQGVPSTQVGSGVTGLSALAVKQETSDGQLKSQAVQTKGGQSAQKPGESSHTQVQGSSAEVGQLLAPQGSTPGSFSSAGLNLVQPGGVGSVPASGILSGQGAVGVAGPMKQVGGQRVVGSGSTPVPGVPPYNSSAVQPAPSPLGVVAPLPAGTAPGQIAQAPGTSVGASSAPVKTPSKKPSVGQKKPAESSPAQQPSSKKQKTSAAGEADQSIDQLNDVTAVSGVNLKEEEEQLLVGPKEESRTTEAMRKIVQEEEERLFLDRSALRTKLVAIAGKCNVKGVSEDVERCISMAVEERLRSMLYKLSKLSKQRCDVEKDRHKICITSDVRRQLLLMKKRAKELQDKKQAEESERLRRLSEKKEKGSLPDGEREELRAKAQKAQQEEDDRLKANAANAAARAAVGASNMLLKWQMMAEQGRQKRQVGDTGSVEEHSAGRAGGSDGAAAKAFDKKAENGDATAGGSATAETDSQGSLAATASATGRPPGPGPGGVTRMLSVGGRRPLTQSGRGQRVINLRDVIAFLETEPQMSKSDILYRLYEREKKPSDGDRIGVGSRK
ncbi:hypothetical protein R1flu_011425 [Riccia fluitans]|uniref:RST domain-containing protein n=1 Tax=Riccia fluitans TaxID=41844 RepID=A0ABD1Z805_9MARC